MYVNIHFLFELKKVSIEILIPFGDLKLLFLNKVDNLSVKQYDSIYALQYVSVLSIK